MRFKGRRIYGGKAVGEALVTSQGISFYGGVDPDNGVIIEGGHEIRGESIAGRILIFPRGKGSTVGSYTLYRLKRRGKAPAAIVNKECEAIVAVGCILSEIPCIDQVEVEKIPGKALVMVDADEGVVEVVKR